MSLVEYQKNEIFTLWLTERAKEASEQILIELPRRNPLIALLVYDNLLKNKAVSN